MKIENQVLSIEQVQELQELGFDVRKHSSMYYLPYYNSSSYKIDGYILDTIEKNDSFNSIPTMSIGDIIEVLPEKIKTYSAIADKELYFYLRVTKSEVIYAPLIIDDFLSCSNEDKLINILFKTLIWCIKEKHIKL